MTSVSREAIGLGAATAARFVVTLCRLRAPVSIKPPQARHLQRFQFFVSRARQPSGGVQRYLQMGFFSTEGEAEQYAQRLRGSYPGAAVSPVPEAFVRQWLAQIPTLPPRDKAEPAHGGDDSLLSPDDTETRRVLEDAVVRGAPVSFAVQLLSSAEPIDVARVPTLSIFRAHTLYQVAGKRDERVWHFLRLGFFSDAISAKQVAYYVRSKFASVAVVPVSEAEQGHAANNRIDSALTATEEAADAFRQRINQALDTTRAPPVSSERSGELKSLEQTLELLAASEIWNDPDSLSETGVRHLSIDVQGRARKR